MNEKLSYYLIRTATYPLQWFPDSWLHAMGKVIGSMCYYILHRYRKRALSNLSMAGFDIGIAKRSFQNLAINCLEYPKLCRSTNYSCENPEVAGELHAKGHGIIFFCAHQANWELLFLDGTSRMKGIAIGKPIKNNRLYDWVVRVREKNGGKIIAQKNALKEGSLALKEGKFLGIVGDRGMPNSSYTYPFFGRIAKFSTAPAYLAYKNNCPIIFAENRRVGSSYRIHYSDPLWPDLTKPMDQEVKRLMDQVFRQLEVSIRKNPDQWLWQHNLWKQQTPKNIIKPYRQDCLCVILPENPPHILKTIRELYPTEFVAVLAPFGYQPEVPVDELIHYQSSEELFRTDYRFKLIFNFTTTSLRRHYLKYSAFEVIEKPPIPDTLKQILCRRNAHAS